MKKFFTLLVLAACCAAMTWGCSDDKYDDTEIRQEIENLKQEIASMKEQVNSLKTIIDALNENKFITNYTEETDKDPLFGDESGENLSYESLPADHPVTNYRARQVASCLRNNSPLSTPIKRISHQPK